MVEYPALDCYQLVGVHEREGDITALPGPDHVVGQREHRHGDELKHRWVDDPLDRDTNPARLAGRLDRHQPTFARELLATRRASGQRCPSEKDANDGTDPPEHA